jgi:hypothetical protein
MPSPKRSARSPRARAKFTSTVSMPAENNSATPPLPIGYAELLDQLKGRIRTTQVRAALAVNRELIQLYWDIGKAIAERQRINGWGRSVVEQLATDLQAAFPGVAGFSPQNVWKMRAFFLGWAGEPTNLSQAVRDLCDLQPPPAVMALPWGHNMELISS